MALHYLETNCNRYQSNTIRGKIVLMEKPLLRSKKIIYPFFSYALFVLSLAQLAISCREKIKPPARDNVEKKEAWEERTAKNLKQYLVYAEENNGKLNDTLAVRHFRLLNSFYKQNKYQLIWSVRGSSKYIGTKLFEFIKDGRTFGLFPEDYGLSQLERNRVALQIDS